MRDIGNEETEQLLRELEARIDEIYTEAALGMQKKMQKYLKDFIRKDKAMRERMENGEISAKDYADWRKGQFMIGIRWRDMCSTLSADLHNSNLIAMSVAYGFLPEVYALNHDYTTFCIERDSLVDTSYALYSHDAVELLIRDNPQLLPNPRPGSKTARMIAENKDLRWNYNLVNSAMLQGILQGESLQQITDRVAVATSESNRKVARRNATTMFTGAQNAGRMEAMKRAIDMGIDVKKRWTATFDNYTRHTHRLLDGQIKPVNEPFTVEGMEIMKPGDPNAAPALVYNCRCHLRSVSGTDNQDLSPEVIKRPNRSGMEYGVWRESKPNYYQLKKEFRERRQNRSRKK